MVRPMTNKKTEQPMIDGTDIANYNALQKNNEPIKAAVKEAMAHLKDNEYRLLEVKTPGPYSTDDMTHFDKTELYMTSRTNPLHPFAKIQIDENQKLKLVYVDRTSVANFRSATYLTEGLEERLELHLGSLDFNRPAKREEPQVISKEDPLAKYTQDQIRAFNKGSGSADELFTYHSLLEKEKKPITPDLQSRVSRLYQPATK